MVRVAVEAFAPVMLSEDGTLHVAGLIAFDGAAVTIQFRFTVPVNPYEGVTVIVTVFPLGMPGAIVTSPLLLKAKVAGGERMIVIVAGKLVTAPLVTENVKLSEPDNWDGGE